VAFLNVFPDRRRFFEVRKGRKGGGCIEEALLSLGGEIDVNYSYYRDNVFTMKKLVCLLRAVKRFTMLRGISFNLAGFAFPDWLFMKFIIGAKK